MALLRKRRTFILLLGIQSAWSAPLPVAAPESSPEPRALRPAAAATARTQARPAGTPARSGAFSPSIRVRLTDSAVEARARGFDLRIYETLSGPERKLAAETDRVSEWDFRCRGGKVYARPRQGKRVVLRLRSPAQLESPAGFVTVAGRPYRERILIHAAKSGCEVVNEVDIEKYLDGLVNSEFSAKWSEEAIAAQVVAARTYAYHQMKTLGASRHFDVDATTRDQVYDGTFREDFRSSRSVNRTRGVVLVDAQSGAPAPIKAFYHSTCGGRTELPERVWGKPFAGMRHGVTCPFCADAPKARWKIELTSAEIQRAVAAGASQAGADLEKRWGPRWRDDLRAGKLVDLRVARSSPDSRADRVELTLKTRNGPVAYPVPAPLFRAWVGATRLLSTWFDVGAADPSRQRWRFNGKGNGHGVGLCQWGAKAMGERGFKASAILRQYYPDATLRKLW